LKHHELKRAASAGVGQVKDVILERPELTSLSILKAPQGKNFPVSDEEAAAIMDLISADSSRLIGRSNIREIRS
jgi:hypothetical protein